MSSPTTVNRRTLLTILGGSIANAAGTAQCFFARGLAGPDGALR